tara:strand:- start:309 stop:947 length:639 start_codon:yes stop_codon:yes gene_type:complete
MSDFKAKRSISKLEKLYKNTKYRKILDKMITEMDNEEVDREEVKLGRKELSEQLKKFNISEKEYTFSTDIKYLQDEWEKDKYEKGYSFDKCLSYIEMEFAVCTKDVEFIYKIFAPFESFFDKRADWDDCIEKGDAIKMVVYSGDEKIVKNILQCFSLFFEPCVRRDFNRLVEWPMLDGLLDNEFQDYKTKYIKCEIGDTEKVMKKIYCPKYP